MLRQPLVRLLVAAAFVVVTMQVTSGWFAIVTTRGISMEPTFHQGDLVFTRRTGGYGVGDIIAYRSEELGDEVVLHRVIGVEGGRYVTQGDNNDFVDADHPTDADVVGRAWLRLPGVGRYLQPFRSLGPIVAGGVAATCFLVALSKRHRAADQDDDGGPPLQPSRRKRPRPAMPAVPRRLSDALSASHLASAAIACAIVAALALARPVEARTSSPAAYDHAASFSYAAPAAASIVYADGSVDVGDPIFRSSVDAVTVAVDYELQRAEDVAGGITLRSVVRVGQWEHVLGSEDPVPLDGGAGTALTRIDLRAIDEVVRDFASVSGQSPPSAVVVVGASVDAVGTVEGTRFSTTFAPELTLEVGGTEVQVDPAELAQTEERSVPIEVAVPSTIGVLGRTVPVSAARAVALPSTLLLGAAAAVRARSGRRPAGRRALEPVPDDPRILHVASFALADRVVEVTDLDTLLRVAEDFDRFVLCATDEIGRRSFAVEHGGTTYRTATTWVP